MTEKKRLLSLFEKLYDASPWIGVNIMDTLSGITPEQAASRAFPRCNTIWEILNHMIAWRINVMQRLAGKVLPAPENNYIERVTDTSADAWAGTLKRLEDTQNQWREFLLEFDEGSYEKIYAPNGMTYYEHIQGIIQHDAYHLGQIVILAKEVS